MHITTIADLVARLLEFDQSLEVYTPGFDEDGLEPISTMTIAEIASAPWPENTAELAERIEFYGYENIENRRKALIINWQ